MVVAGLPTRDWRRESLTWPSRVLLWPADWRRVLETHIVRKPFAVVDD
jgi:hypothetical protein